MKTLKIKYYVDNRDWTDGQFNDEPQRELIIDVKDIIEYFGDLKKGEFVHEFEIEK